MDKLEQLTPNLFNYDSPEYVVAWFITDMLDDIKYTDNDKTIDLIFKKYVNEIVGFLNKGDNNA